MKNIFKSILMLLTLAVGFASCTSEEADLFDKSAAQRLNQSVEKYQRLLESSQYGWVMEFFPSDGSYGGYVYTAKFSEGDVDMACELSFSNSTTGDLRPAGTVVSSKYTVKSEQSVILTFDTYNLLFHYWSEPKSSYNTDGYESDYEFVFLRTSADGDSIYLRGKKYENELVMVKLKEDSSEYLEKVMANETEMAYFNYSKLQVNGKGYPISLTSRQFTFTDEEGNVTTIPFIYNGTGIRLYEPITIDGISYQDFSFNNSTGNIDAADGAASILCPSGNEQLLNTDSPWCFLTTEKAADMNDELLTLFNTAITARSSKSYVIQYVGFANATVTSDKKLGFEKVLSFSWIFNNSSASNINYGISLNIDDEANNIISINGLGEGYRFSSYRKKLTPFVEAILEASPFKVTYDDNYRKTEATLTSVADSNVWFKLYKN